MSDTSIGSYNNFPVELGVFRGTNDIRPQLADLIEIDRTLYHHMTIYVGDGYVVHVVGKNDEDYPDSDSAVVKKIPLATVAADNYVRINNKEVPAKERSLTPLDPDVVVRKCLSMVGKLVEYNLLTHNCEHYLTKWKYGQGWSDQAAVALTSINALKSSCTDGHTFLLNSINDILNSPGNAISASPPTFLRTASVSSQTERTHVN